MKTVGLLGFGKLNKIITKAFVDGFLNEYRLLGVYSRDEQKTRQGLNKLWTSEEPLPKVFTDYEALITDKPDYIVEAASIPLFKKVAPLALKNGCSLIPLSIGALADENFRQKVEELARKHWVKVHLPSGAIGGLDVLHTVSLMDAGANITFTTKKGPDSLKDSSVYSDALQEIQKEVFAGSAKEAIKAFPTKVNVAIAASLAAGGPESTQVSINSLPDYIGDDHRIELESEEVKAVIDIYSKTSDIAAWSVIHTLRNLANPIQFS